jgi:WD40 repeat protein
MQGGTGMRFIAPLLLGLTLLTSDLRAQQPTGDVLPMLNTGGHTLPIVGISFTPDGRQLVSASEDKTIRVWDLATGKTVRTIRGESTLGIQGKIYAMALSPDGKWLAVGGWNSEQSVFNEFGIRLYDSAQAGSWSGSRPRISSLST